MDVYCRVIKSAANVNTSSSASNLQLAEGEIILEIDGTVPTQPIFQHIGISGWPGWHCLPLKLIPVVRFDTYPCGFFISRIWFASLCNVYLNADSITNFLPFGRAFDIDQ